MGGHTTPIVWHICLAMSKQAQMGGLRIYYLLSLKFSVGAVWRIGFIQLQGISKSALAPKDTQLQSKWELGTRDTHCGLRGKNYNRYQWSSPEHAKVSREKKP
jgi:hypothetical protein